jgi:hypothetical protein
METIKLDSWQEKVLNTKGNLCICAGRQVGKSTIISRDAGEYAINNPGTSIMIIAAVERSALLLFEKVLSYIHQKDKKLIATGKDKPLKTKLKLKNGSIINCLPTGDSGYGIRGHTIDRLYADEAAFIKEPVWAAVTPMLATTGGDIVLLSTPLGIDNYFCRAFNSDQFTSFHINAEEVAESREEPQRTNMLNHQKEEKIRMSKLQYQQEYQGLFVGGIQRLFSDQIIDNVCTLKEPGSRNGNIYLGIDVARMGGDETVLVSLIEREGNLAMIDMEIPPPQRLTDTTRIILYKDRKYNYNKIYIDDGGLGVGVYDPLLEHDQTKRKIVAINNAKRSQDKLKGKDSPRVKALLKEDLYLNLLNLMEKNRIKIFDNPQIKHSLRSIQYENEYGRLLIYGNYSHIAEALIRAAWCLKDKSLNIYVY